MKIVKVHETYGWENGPQQLAKRVGPAFALRIPRFLDSRVHYSSRMASAGFSLAARRVCPATMNTTIDNASNVE